MRAKANLLSAAYASAMRVCIMCNAETKIRNHQRRHPGIKTISFVHLHRFQCYRIECCTWGQNKYQASIQLFFAQLFAPKIFRFLSFFSFCQPNRIIFHCLILYNVKLIFRHFKFPVLSRHLEFEFSISISNFPRLFRGLSNSLTVILVTNCQFELKFRNFVVVKSGLLEKLTFALIGLASGEFPLLVNGIQRLSAVISCWRENTILRHP